MKAYVPIEGLEDWEQQQHRQQQQQQQQQQGRHRFELLVRLAQGDPGRAPVCCAGCGRPLDLRCRGATTSPGGVTRCRPCGARAHA